MGVQKRILIVEDSTTQAMRLQHVLKIACIETVVAAGGQQAIDVLNGDQAFDAILSDIDMPEIDGFELCKRVKQMPSVKKIPFVILVSLKDMKDVVRSLECGADNMLMKEYDKAYFLPQLETIMSTTGVAESAGNEHCKFEFGGNRYEVQTSSSRLAAMLISTFAMAVQQKAANLPVAGKA